MVPILKRLLLTKQISLVRFTVQIVKLLADVSMLNLCSVVDKLLPFSILFGHRTLYQSDQSMRDIRDHHIHYCTSPPIRPGVYIVAILRFHLLHFE